MPSEGSAELKVAGLTPILAAIAGSLVWAMHFGVVYATTAIICARGQAERLLLGWPVLPVLVLGATGVALAAIGSIALSAHRRLPSDLSGEEGEDDPLFMVWLSLAIALLSGLAILREGIPVLLLRPCG